MKIEKNVQMPTGIRGPKPIYPFREMEIGDSIVAPGSAAVAEKCKAYNAATQYGRRNNKKFAGQKEPGQPGMVRIWRTA